MAVIEGVCRIVGGVDTHKDLHVAAIVDEQDRIIGTRSFATTRQGYRQMLAWMRSFGELQRIGIESTGSYGAGLLRFMQQANVTVLEVTTPDKQDRRRRGKNDDLDAQNAAHAAFAGQRTVTPRSRDGMIESLRVLMACRKTAVSARRVALQMIHNTIVCALTACAINCATSPACSSSVRWPRGDPILLPIATWILPIASASSPSLAVTSSCMTRSQISTR